MASITIRNLEEPLKSRLRIRAAHRGRSMEEEARQILRAALTEPDLVPTDLAKSIRARFASLGGVDLPERATDLLRDPPRFDE